MNELKYAEILFKARVNARLSQAGLSMKTGLNVPAISRYENGRVMPRLDRFEQWLEACGYEMVVRKKE